MNRVFLIGNLGNDADLKVLASGDVVANFSLATSEKWTDKESGEKKEKTEWHRCALFGKRASSVAKFLTKGTKLAVEGSITYRSYEQDGVKKYATDIKVNNVEFLGGGKGGEQSTPSGDDGAPNPVSDDELPF